MTVKLIVSMAAMAVATTLLSGPAQSSQPVVGEASAQSAIETPGEAVDLTKYDGKPAAVDGPLELPAVAPSHLPNHIQYVRNLASGQLPEPGAWAMMLIGFGGAGALLRRSRRRARAASI